MVVVLTGSLSLIAQRRPNTKAHRRHGLPFRALFVNEWLSRKLVFTKTVETRFGMKRFKPFFTPLLHYSRRNIANPQKKARPPW